MGLKVILRAAFAAAALCATAFALASGFIDAPEKAAQVRPGKTTLKELEALLGRPAYRLSFPWQGLEAWEYEIGEYARRPVFSYAIGKDGVVRGFFRYTP